MILRLYRFLCLVATPFLWLLLLWRLSSGQESTQSRREKMGKTDKPRFDRAPIWIHAVSLGELMSVLPLIDKLSLTSRPLLVTTSTQGSVSLLSRLPKGVMHQFFPLDHPDWVDRFLAHWQPSLALFTESELWPNHFSALTKRAIPLLIINARLSQTSQKLWQRWPAFAHSLFLQPSLWFVQNEDYYAPLKNLGAREVRFAGNLKLDAPPLPVNSPDFDDWEGLLSSFRLIVAASLHPGEESLVARSFAQLRKVFPDLRLVLVPRHPESSKLMIEAMQREGETVEQFSKAEIWSGKTSVWLDDSFGRLGLFYRLADLVWLGGSWVDLGGHNPVEAINLGCFVIHGPSKDNFRDIYRYLESACLEAEGKDDLVSKTINCLSTPDSLRSGVDEGMKIVASHRGTAERLVGDITKAFPEIFREETV